MCMNAGKCCDIVVRIESHLDKSCWLKKHEEGSGNLHLKASRDVESYNEFTQAQPTAYKSSSCSVWAGLTWLTHGASKIYMAYCTQSQILKTYNSVTLNVVSVIACTQAHPPSPTVTHIGSSDTLRLCV